MTQFNAKKYVWLKKIKFSPKPIAPLQNITNHNRVVFLMSNIGCHCATSHLQQKHAFEH